MVRTCLNVAHPQQFGYKGLLLEQLQIVDVLSGSWAERAITNEYRYSTGRNILLNLMDCTLFQKQQTKTFSFKDF